MSRQDNCRFTDPPDGIPTLAECQISLADLRREFREILRLVRWRGDADMDRRRDRMAGILWDRFLAAGYRLAAEATEGPTTRWGKRPCWHDETVPVETRAAVWYSMVLDYGPDWETWPPRVCVQCPARLADDAHGNRQYCAACVARRRRAWIRRGNHTAGAVCTSCRSAVLPDNAHGHTHECAACRRRDHRPEAQGKSRNVRRSWRDWHARLVRTATRPPMTHKERGRKSGVARRFMTATRNRAILEGYQHGQPIRALARLHNMSPAGIRHVLARSPVPALVSPGRPAPYRPLPQDVGVKPGGTPSAQNLQDGDPVPPRLPLAADAPPGRKKDRPQGGGEQTPPPQK